MLIEEYEIFVEECIEGFRVLPEIFLVAIAS